MTKSKIIIADDHAMIRNGVRALLSKNKDWIVVSEANNGAETLAMYAKHKPDLVILDISMGDMSGMEVTEKILSCDANAKVLILSMYDDEDYISKCIESGVKGYVVKNESGNELEYAVKTVLNGQTYFSQHVQQVIFQKFSSHVGKPKVVEPDLKLTTREIEIIKLISEGLTSHEMAEKLFISPRTVETHRANLIKKTGVKNSVELIRKMEKIGIIK
jgi:DNA-binding NarL/FixJ family response regulator